MEIRPDGFAKLAERMRSVASPMEQYRRSSVSDALSSTQLSQACVTFSNNWGVQLSVTQFRIEDFADICAEYASATSSNVETAAELLSP